MTSSAPTTAPTSPTSTPTSQPTAIPDCGNGYEYYYVDGNAVCEKCPIGYYNPTKSTSQCTQAPAGWYAPSGSANAIICPKNTYGRPAGIRDRCDHCPSGTTSKQGSINDGGCHGFSIGWIILVVLGVSALFGYGGKILLCKALFGPKEKPSAYKEVATGNIEEPAEQHIEMTEVNGVSPQTVDSPEVVESTEPKDKVSEADVEQPEQQTDKVESARSVEPAV